MPLASNSRFGRYEIRSQIGEGGMGKVYLARDTQLGRMVALKILTEEVSSNQERLRRFQQEARAAAALNHPNIAHIYETGVEDGTHFIAMEFVEGETLHEKIHREKAPLGKLLKYLAQVAAGLAKAHAAGIVHRDLKPDNIMIARDGYAKILDFGLAKLIEPQTQVGNDAANEAATVLMSQHSLPGMVIGTVGYMSPEQALGKVGEVDHRSDIFSFGCILFEAATKQRAFQGKDALDTLHKIVHEPAPKIRDSNAAGPEELQRIVRRCLVKDPEKRYQSIKDVAIELEEIFEKLKSEEGIQTSVPPAPGSQISISSSVDQQIFQRDAHQSAPSIGSVDSTQPKTSSEFIIAIIRQHRLVVALMALTVIIAVLVFALYKYARRGQPAPMVFQNAQVSRLTTSGIASEANISPDGKYVAYVERQTNGNKSLWVKQTATGNTLQIVPPAKVALGATTFSPDGNFIYYRMGDLASDGFSLYQAASIGGSEPKRVLTDVGSPVAISPDGRQAAFVREDRGYKFDLVVANLDGTGESVLASRENDKRFSQGGPAWSPDGKTIACSATTNAGGDTSFLLLGVDVKSRAVKELSPQRWLFAARAAWLPDGSTILILAGEPSRLQLWRVSNSDGAASPITNDLSDRGARSLGVTADGRTIVTTVTERVSQIWTMPASGDISSAKQITSGAGQDGHMGLAWTPDKRLVFSSLDGGQSDIWIMNADGSNRKRVTSDAYKDYSPAVSPDGRYIVFESYRQKNNIPHLWRMDMDGGNLKQLTSVEDEDPQISPDGKQVVYRSWVPGVQGSSMWQVSIDGGTPVQLTDYYIQLPTFSPDGKWIACLYYDDQVEPKRWRTAIIPATGGVKPVKLFDRPNLDYQFVRWTLDGHFLSYIGEPAYPSNISLQPVGGGEPRKLTDFNSGIIYLHAWSPDGKTLAIARGTEMSDVVLMRDAR